MRRSGLLFLSLGFVFALHLGVSRANDKEERIRITIDGPYFSLVDKKDDLFIWERLCLAHNCSSGRTPFGYPGYCTKYNSAYYRKNMKKPDQGMKGSDICGINRVESSVEFDGERQFYHVPYPEAPVLKWNPEKLLYYDGLLRPDHAGYQRHSQFVDVMLVDSLAGKGKPCA